MRGIGTVVNVITVLTGTVIGLAVGPRLPARLKSTVLSGVGLVTIVIGVQEATKTRNIVLPLVALIVGGALGELAGIEERLERFGDRIRRRFETGDQTSTFVAGFVAASLLFCVGPLTVLGSIQ